jgi:hypothetical protein
MLLTSRLELKFDHMECVFAGLCVCVCVCVRRIQFQKPSSQCLPVLVRSSQYLIPTTWRLGLHAVAMRAQVLFRGHGTTKKRPFAYIGILPVSELEPVCMYLHTRMHLGGHGTCFRCLRAYADVRRVGLGLKSILHQPRPGLHLVL